MLRLPRPVWTQLAILATITVVAVRVMAFGFVNVPALLGVGRYTVTVDLPASGGLYPTLGGDLPRAPRSAGSSRSTSPATVFVPF